MCSLFRVSASASASFRVNPWQILPLILSSASVFSVKFRVNPWLIFSLLLPLLGVYSVLKITMVGLGKLGRISQFFVASKLTGFIYALTLKLAQKV
ncbi:MAG: hypothetical protein DWH95_01935 [Planctomycetota bacterium]|nr:MAG: hypothetical protein DWH95_01935 [Planctomycetota bacterium]